MKTHSRNRLFSLLSLLAVGGIILALTFDSFRELCTTYQAQSWEKTPCEVTSVSLEKHTHKRGRRKRAKTESFSLIAHYSYEFNGRRRTGHHYDCGRIEYSKEDALRLKRALEQQPDPHCYVNPDNPQQAVIDRSLNTGTAIQVAAGVGIYTLALVILLLQKDTHGRKRPRKHKNQKTTPRASRAELTNQRRSRA